jgi:hypothetical protein
MSSVCVCVTTNPAGFHGAMKRAEAGVQTWHKGANLATRRKPRSRVQNVQEVGIPPAPLHLPSVKEPAL